jgi:hypothetical protein
MTVIIDALVGAGNLKKDRIKIFRKISKKKPNAITTSTVSLYKGSIKPDNANKKSNDLGCTFLSVNVSMVNVDINTPITTPLCTSSAPENK